MRTSFTLCLTGALALAAGLASAQSFTLNPNAPSVTGSTARGACGPTTLTQTTSQVPVVGSISCNATGLHRDNSYFRAYSMAAFPAGFTTCAVEVGIETANASGTGTTQPITVNIYSNTGGAFPAGTRSVVGTATVQVADQTLSLLTVPVTGTVPAGAELVVEVLSPDGQPAGHSFFIGSNAGGQSAPGYIQAAACGVTTPTNLATIGFPTMHMIINPIGTAGAGGTGALTIAPTAIDFGNQGVGTTSTASSVTLENTGTAALNVSAISAAAAPFALSGGTCGAVPFSLATGASCTLQYQFTPTVAGAANQTLNVTVDAPATGSGTIALSGTGVTGTLTYSSATVEFGAQNVGASVSRTLTLSNTGGAALSISAITPPTAPFALTGGTCGALPINLAAGASCTLIYSYTPTVAGTANQVLTVTTNATGGGPITLNARGVVAIPLPVSSTLSALVLLLGMVGVAGVVLVRRNG